MSQALKLGHERYVAVRVWWVMGNRSGMPGDVQASGHDSIAHVQRFFPPKYRSR